MTTTRTPRSPRWDFMGRYQVHVEGELFIDRLRVIQVPWFAILLTRIHRPDTGRDPHSHSRPFLTFILSGSYQEDIYHGSTRTGQRSHPRFSARFLSRHLAHEITGITGPLRTLVVAGRHQESFFFWTADGPVPWQDYR